MVENLDFLLTRPAFDALVRGGGGPHQNIAITFSMQKLECCGDLIVEKF